jgi:hypothetical protein
VGSGGEERDRRRLRAREPPRIGTEVEDYGACALREYRFGRDCGRRGAAGRVAVRQDEEVATSRDRGGRRRGNEAWFGCLCRQGLEPRHPVQRGVRSHRVHLPGGCTKKVFYQERRSSNVATGAKRCEGKPRCVVAGPDMYVSVCEARRIEEGASDEEQEEYRGDKD